MDRLDKDQRRKNMQAVKSKDSKIEVKLRNALWHKGHRYRKNYGRLEGKPDIVLPKHRIVIFCDSEFWHGYDWDKKKHEIKSNKEFWMPKIERNMQRDAEVNQKLQDGGWTVLRFWGKEIDKNLESCLDIIESNMKKGRLD